MYKFIQRNKKAFLAVFGVLLMIVFLMPSDMKGVGSSGKTTYGKMGETEIISSDVTQAHNDIVTLGSAAQSAEFQLQQMQMFRQQQFPEDVLTVFIAGRTIQQFKERPVAYVLLQKEAEAAGIVPPMEEVEKLAVALAQFTSGESDAVIRAMARRYLFVHLNHARVSSIVKATMPEVEQAVITQQEPIVNLVEVKAEEFVPQVAAPTPEQIQEIYNKYASEAPDAAGTLSATRPVRFGYLIPDKYKLQHLRIPRDKLMEAAVHTLTPADLRDLDRVGVNYYDKHPEEFRIVETPKPTREDLVLGPFTQPSTNPTTQPATGPTTRPFSVAVGELRRKLILSQIEPDFGTPEQLVTRLKAVQDKVSKKADELQAEVARRLQEDFEKHQKGEPIMLAPVPATRPTTAPSTQPTDAANTQPAAATQPAGTQPTTLATAQPAPAFESPEYLEAVLANVLAAKTGVNVDELKLLEAPKPPTPGRVPGPASRQAGDDSRLAVTLEDKWYTKSDLAGISVLNSAVAGPDKMIDLVTRPAAGDLATAPSTAPASSAPGAPAGNPATAPTTTPTTEPATNPATNATASASPTTAPATRPVGRSAWTMYQPSSVLTGPAVTPPRFDDPQAPPPSSGDAYIFRLTGYEGRRTPPLDEIREKIVQDLKLAKAYELAREDADKIRKAAASRSMDAQGGLPGAAELSVRPLLIIGPIDRRSPYFPKFDAFGELYELPDEESRNALHRGTMMLLSRAKVTEPHPSSMIDLPSAGRAVVAELRGVERPWGPHQDYTRQREILQSVLSQEISTSPGLANWYKVDDIIKRTKYVPSRGGE